jgi:hypothetical protein
VSPYLPPVINLKKAALYNKAARIIIYLGI